ncbi:uncharacterized protein LOC126394445 [Epinephelus moara]|uniref:uncharacterized protein LOC126394445 n=1 Tax=Epinephelus moara TaxID=300413 RepID=UPI00214E7BCD|nr:uncharacterized protein LOC126394445 [Epinephelus moara]
MSLCLYECLKAVGLQRHYARFTSVGVHRAAHLSALTMEDYSILGIRSMEDRTRLFHLIQMVKTLDLEYEDGDDDYDADEDCAVADNSFTYDDVYDDDDQKGAVVSKLSTTIFSKPSSVRRRLDFSSETTDHHLKLSSPPEGAVHVYASHNRNNEPGQGKGSAVALQLDTGSAVVCGCKGKNNHRLDVHSHQSDHHTGANTEPKTFEGYSMYTSPARLSPKCVKPKPRPATGALNRFSNKPVGHKDGKRISRKEKLITEMNNNMATEHKPTPVYESKTTAGYNYGLPLSSPPAPNKKQPEGQRITVCVRKRPLTRTECRRGEADVVTTPSGECVIVHEGKEAVDLTQYILQHKFYFDQVFGEESSNEEVYLRTAYPLVQHMLNGGKATCFAYGQTGAGKTHTMLGSPSGRPGLYSLAVRDIFALLSTTHMHPPLMVYVSFFEIYCGQLYDLLDHRKRLFAREDGQKVVHIVGLRDVRVDSVSSLLEVISQGTEERTQGVSGVNPLSSRSHALLQIQLRGPNQQIAGRMWFVDLAGSERASDTKEPDRQSRMEGAEINQSLLALKECIRSLDQEQSHTPFRQSKLTQVLKDSFVGDSMTCMIANISPGHLATEHTLNTLRYADRVKELKGQGGLRGGRRGKTTASPKRNLSNSSSSSSSSGGNSLGTRGKSPPKKPKLGRQREDFGPTTPTMRLATGGTILCSTPKNIRWEEETSASAMKEIGLEHITPVRGLLGTGERRERADGREGRRRERYGITDRVGHSVGDQNVSAGLVLGQADEQLYLWEVQRESGFDHREKENQQCPLKGGGNKERRPIEQRRQVESSRNTWTEVREKDLPKANEKDKERERHLRWYHQQLQQSMPSPDSSSVNLFSPSTCLSFSSSNQASLSSSVSPSSSSPFQHSSNLSVSALTSHGLTEILDAYRARVEVRAEGNRGQLSVFPSGEIGLQNEPSPSCSKNKDELGHGESGGVGDFWREGTDERIRQNRDRNEKSRSLKATVEEELRRKEWRPAGMGGGGEERRCAWVATIQTKGADRMTGAIPADAEALMSNNCDSEERREESEEELHASDAPVDGVWSNEEREGADGYSLLSTHSDSLFNHPPAESSHRRAPAERPLSPACEHTGMPLTPNKPSDLSLKLKDTRCTSNILHLPLQNAQQGVPSSSCIEKQAWFVAHANRSCTLPLSTPITKYGCKLPAEPPNTLSESPAFTQVHSHRKVEAEMSVLPQEETADSLSCVMDPLSVSLLQVDQQVATASFLQGEQSNSSFCPLVRGGDNRRKVEKEHLTCAEMAGKVVVDKDEELRLSFLELPQAKTQHPPASDIMTATDHTERGKDMCCATYDHCGIESNHEESTSNQQIRPKIHLSTLEDMDRNQWRVVQAHWEQLEEMEALCRKEGTLLCQQPNMAFGEYVHKLEDIMERKARCVHSMLAQLQPYLKPSLSKQPHNQGKDNHDPIT